MVDRGEHRVRFAQVDDLDVAVAAEHRLGAAADQGGSRPKPTSAP